MRRSGVRFSSQAPSQTESTTRQHELPIRRAGGDIRRGEPYVSTVDIAREGMEFLRRCYERVNRGEFLALAEILPADFIINMPFEMSEPLHGPEVWRAGTQNMVDAFPDLQVEIDDMFGSGDRVAVRVTFRATH